MTNLDVFLPKFIAVFLLPPLNVLALGVCGASLRKRRPRLGGALLATAGLLFYVLSAPVIVRTVRSHCEAIPPLDPAATPPPAEAIVLLAGGLYRNAPEYGVDTVDGYVLERLRYAARLYRLTGKPLLVTGGSWRKGARPESQAMKEALEQDFHVPVQWVEDRSRTTFENAQLSAPLLQQQGIHTIYLVTHALHMERSRAAFEKLGFHVIPAPTMYATWEKTTVFDFLPHSSTLAMSSAVLYEWLGRKWYAWK